MELDVSGLNGSEAETTDHNASVAAPAMFPSSLWRPRPRDESHVGKGSKQQHQGVLLWRAATKQSSPLDCRGAVTQYQDMAVFAAFTVPHGPEVGGRRRLTNDTRGMMAKVDRYATGLAAMFRDDGSDTRGGTGRKDGAWTWRRADAAQAQSALIVA